MKNRTKIAIIVVVFLSAYFIPFEKIQIQKAFLESLFMLQEYAREQLGLTGHQIAHAIAARLGEH